MNLLLNAYNLNQHRPKAFKLLGCLVEKKSNYKDFACFDENTR
jgi:hypothetical protein